MSEESKLKREITEEVLENLVALLDSDQAATLSALSKRSDIPIGQLTKYVEKLKGEGFLENIDGLVPTDKGRTLGLKMVRKHRLLERFFSDKFGMRKDRVHDEACRLEHELSDDAEAALCRFMEHPQNCPDDNRPIPVCHMDIESCEDCESGKPGHSRTVLVPLSSVTPGMSARIKFIRGGRNCVRRLRDMGLVTNAEVTMIKRTPFNGPLEILTHSTTLAIGRKIADKVFVELC